MDFTNFIRCQRCGTKATGTMHGAGRADGTYCAACGRRTMEDIIEEKTADLRHARKLTGDRLR